MSISHTQDPTTQKWHMQYILEKTHIYDPVDEITVAKLLTESE
jgi:hypothetical protein